VVVERRSAGDAGGSAFNLKPFKDPFAEIEARGWRVEARRVRHPGFGGSRQGSGGENRMLSVATPGPPHLPGNMRRPVRTAARTRSE